MYSTVLLVEINQLQEFSILLILVKSITIYSYFKIASNRKDECETFVINKIRANIPIQDAQYVLYYILGLTEYVYHVKLLTSIYDSTTNAVTHTVQACISVMLSCMYNIIRCCIRVHLSVRVFKSICNLYSAIGIYST